MSVDTVQQTHAYPVCPDWCTEHIYPDDLTADGVRQGSDMHMAADRRGEASGTFRDEEWLVGIGFSADTGEGHDTPIDCGRVEQMSPEQARALAKALLDAATEVEASWAIEAAREALRGPR